MKRANLNSENEFLKNFSQFAVASIIFVTAMNIVGFFISNLIG